MLFETHSGVCDNAANFAAEQVPIFHFARSSALDWRISVYFLLCKGLCLYAREDGTVREIIEAPVDELPPQPEGSMRVVCLSDTHLTHRFFSVKKKTLPKGDVLLHCGDILFLDRGSEQDVRGDNNGVKRLKEFNCWLGEQTCFQHRVVIGGNHDRILQELGQEKSQKLLTNATYLDDTVAELHIEGGLSVRVFGSPHSCGSSQNSAFQVNGETKVKCWDNVPDVDIFMSHCTPWPKQPSPGGCRFHIGGHVHKMHGIFFKQRGANPLTVICAAVVDNWYWPSQVPIVFDFAPK